MIFFADSMRSPLTVQHTHPFGSSTICSSSLDTINSESIPTSPNSFTITPIFSPWSPVSTLFRNVVFPDPNAPVTIVTGIFIVSCLSDIFINHALLKNFMKVVMSVGGSLINPGKINVSFLKSLKKFVKGKSAVIVCGGGKPARDYMSAAKKVGVKSVDDVGIAATVLNASLVASMFNTKVTPEPKRSRKKVIVGCGFKPGYTTDTNTVMWAKKLGVGKVVNLTNVDYVYTKSPKLKGARPIKCMSWTDYIKMIPKKHVSGIHVPFDPIASRLAKRHGISVGVINGKRLSEVSKFLAGKKFIGTVLG